MLYLSYLFVIEDRVSLSIGFIFSMTKKTITNI